MIDSQYRVVREIETSLIETISEEMKAGSLSARERKFLISVWAHFFSHSALAIWFEENLVPLNYSQNYLNVPADTSAFLALNRTSEYAKYLRSSLNQDNTEEILHVEKRVSVIDVGKMRGIRVFLYKPGFSKKFRLLLRVFSLGKIRSYSRLMKLTQSPVDREKRNQIKEKLSRQFVDFSFAKWLAIRSVEFLPTIFLEDFPKVAKIYQKSDGQVEKIFSRDCWASDDSLKLFSVVVKNSKNENPTKIGSPHALNYGTLKNFWLRNFEMDYLDEYLTWGWEHDDALPFFNPQFSGEKRIAKPKKLAEEFEILITGASRPAHLIECPYSVENFHNYLKNQIYLANELAKKTPMLVTIRTRQKERGQELEKMIQNFAPISFKWEYQGLEFLKRIKNCLHLCDNTSTALIESLWLNQPTILLIEPGYFEIWENALDDFELLSKVGIFHTSKKSAICFIAEHFHIINEWWGSPETQNAVNLFLEKQARPNGSVRNWKNIFLGSSK